MGDINKTIKEFKEVDERRLKLSNEIRDYFHPRLTKAGKSGNESEFNTLLAQIPDCPFMFTAYRLQELYFNNIK